MTTPMQAAMYELEHLSKWDGQPPVVFNPHNKPVEELPFIYGFCNGGQIGWMEGVLVSQDGHILGGHVCSSEAYMPHDLGIVAFARMDRHEEFQKHYPDGYRMEFVPHSKAKDHAGLHAAMSLYVASQQPAPEAQQ